MAEILFETHGAVLVATFNRPESNNAFTAYMAKNLNEKLKAVAEDRGIRAVVLRGTGDHFMDGHEMSVYTGDGNALQDQIFQKVQHFYTAIRELQVMEKPVIAAVDGRVVGAGLNFMLAADLVISTRRAVFNADFTNYAMVPDGGVTFFLPRKVGTTRAAEILLLGEDFTADQAYSWGLVNRMVDDDKLMVEALGWAEKIAARPTRALGAAKRLIGKSFEQNLNEQLSLEASMWNAGTKHFDFREAMKAYSAKREPKFTGS